MNRKISTARKNKTDIIKPKTPARQGNWNKQTKQTNKQSVIWRTIPYNNNNDDDWSSALNGQHWTFVSPSTNFKPTLRMNYIRARGIDDEDFKSSQVTAVIGPPTPSLAQFQPQLRNIGKKKTKSTKSQFNQCLGSFFFFSIPRVFSML